MKKNSLSATRQNMCCIKKKKEKRIKSPTPFRTILNNFELFIFFRNTKVQTLRCSAILGRTYSCVKVCIPANNASKTPVFLSCSFKKHGQRARQTFLVQELYFHKRSYEKIMGRQEIGLMRSDGGVCISSGLKGRTAAICPSISDICTCRYERKLCGPVQSAVSLSVLQAAQQPMR